MLIEKLDKDFILEGLTDEWNNLDLGSHTTEIWKKRKMGLLLDNSDEITKVYTAVFPEEKVIEEILSRNEKNVMLFTHHPMIWKMEEGKHPFSNIPEKYLNKMKENKISMYSLHVPLDKN